VPNFIPSVAGAAAVCLALAGWPGSSDAACVAADPHAPRLLLLSIDGVAYRTMERARERGAFEGWPHTRRLVSTFPSMTNVAFTAIYQPFGVQPIRGYEMRYFDPERNRIVGGGPIGYRKKSFAWKQLYQVISHTNLEKSEALTAPRKMARRAMERAERVLLESTDDVVLAHIESTDMLSHFRGDAPVIDVLVEVSNWVEELARRHEERLGHPLQVVMFSDHGNTETKVHNIGGVHKRLRAAGLQVVERMGHPGDVVAPTYGVVGFGVLFTDPASAELAARAVLTHPAVEIAAWIDGPGAVRVRSKDAEASVEWRDRRGSRQFRYAPIHGDPLRLHSATARLAHLKQTDDAGFASEGDWFSASASSDYPDAPRRLVDSLTGTFVSNPATVIFSLTPGHAWGSKPAQAASQILGGDLEGTHGGLDRVSSNGFLLTNDPAAKIDETAVAAHEALVPWAPSTSCSDDPTVARVSGARSNATVREAGPTP
jgi:hypothetical protein